MIAIQNRAAEWGRPIEPATDNFDHTTTVVQGLIGFGLGLMLHKVYTPLTERFIRMLGISPSLTDPFQSMSFSEKVLQTPLVCLVAPVLEEILFREQLPDYLESKFEMRTDQWGKKLARITAIFFSAILFGLVHFTNALLFRCSPIFFVSQVIAATIMGFVFSLAKECTGNLSLPIGMHMGNNVLAWIQYFRE